MTREELEQAYGQVWDTKELQVDFEVLSFMAPLVVVKVKSTGQKGTLEFQHDPRYYHSLVEEK
jgi:hypothetical protein